MNSMILSDLERTDLVTFYEAQRHRLNAELKHVESFLRKLHGQNTDSETGVLLTLKGKKAKKRGPKSVWGKFILEELKLHDTPLRYSDLIQLAMEKHGKEASDMSKVRASILNSAFRLRAIQGKITTVGEEGKKDKFIVLRQWVSDDGGIRENDLKWLAANHDFYPKTVDTSGLPQPRYAEDID
jgi:hypothetical protein